MAMKPKEMKAIYKLMLVLPLPALVIFAAAAEAQAPALDGKVIVERGLHHRVVQTTNGGSYTELSTGMHFIRDGQLFESQENVLIDANGYGVADQGQHSASFSPSITDSPAVLYSDPEGNQLKIRPLCLAFRDYSSGKSVLFCETKSSIGSVQSNVVIYADAFSDNVLADVIYRYKKGSFESDIAIRSKLPPVSNWNLNPNTVRLQVWHELFDPPVPKVKTTSYIYREASEAARQAYAEPDFTDDFISFGTAHISRGSAFLIDSEAIRQAGIDVEREVPVGKEWVTSRDENTGLFRYFIVESVELGAVQPLLDTLETAAVSKPQEETGRLASTGSRLRFPQRAAKALPRSEFLASLPRAVAPAVRPSPGAAIGASKNESPPAKPALASARASTGSLTAMPVRRLISAHPDTATAASRGVRPSPGAAMAASKIQSTAAKALARSEGA